MGSQGSGSTQSNAGTGLMTAGGIATATGVGAPIGIGLMAAGAGLSAWGAIQSAEDQQQLDEEKARIAREQADEITQREQSNEQIRDQGAYRQKLQFAAAFAGSGKSGTGIGSQLEIQRQTDQMNMMSNRESQFQVSMLKQQAGIDTTLGNETMQAGYINAASSVLSGAARAATAGTSGNRNPGLPGTQPLPGGTG